MYVCMYACIYNIYIYVYIYLQNIYRSVIELLLIKTYVSFAWRDIHARAHTIHARSHI